MYDLAFSGLSYNPSQSKYLLCSGTFLNFSRSTVILLPQMIVDIKSMINLVDFKVLKVFREKGLEVPVLTHVPAVEKHCHRSVPKFQDSLTSANVLSEFHKKF